MNWKNLVKTMFAAMCIGLTLQGCDNEDNGGKQQPVEPIKNVHFDVWASVGGGTGMGSDAAILVQSVNSLEGDEVLDFKTAVDVTATMDAECMIRGKYYYQAAPLKQARFGRYHIAGGTLEKEEKPFAENTYKDRRYTHAFLSNDRLLVMAANGPANEVVWTLLNPNTLEVLKEGNLGLAKLTGFKKFSTSGLLTYRKADNKLIYAFQDKNNNKAFYVAFIDPATMKVEKYIKEDRAEQMAGTAYGELLQHKMFYDEQGNLYIACNSRIPGSQASTCQFGRLLRIKKGETEFDKSYEGFKKNSKGQPDHGKIVTVDYLGYNKAILYIQDPEFTGTQSDNKIYEHGKGWGADFNCYYAMIDLTTDRVTEFTFEGKNLPFSSGTFSQRSFVLNNKAYIGVNPKQGNPCIYVYDVTKDMMKKGISLKEGFEFDRIVYIENEQKAN